MKKWTLQILSMMTLGSCFIGHAEEEKAVKVEVKKMNIIAQASPMNTASNVTNFTYRPKKWLQSHLLVDAKMASNSGANKVEALDVLQVEVYIALSSKTEGKTDVLHGTFSFTDCSLVDESNMLFYVSPNTLKRFLKKDSFSEGADVKAWGILINYNGKLVGGDTSMTGNKWWEKTEGLNIVDNLILAKKDSPYASLWGDFDLQVQKQ
jgi:hypothetical protein